MYEGPSSSGGGVFIAVIITALIFSVMLHRSDRLECEHEYGEEFCQYAIDSVSGEYQGQ